MDPNTEDIDDILRKILSTNLDIGAVVIVSREGLPIASAIPQGIDEMRLSTLISSLFYLGRMLTIEGKKGDFDQVCIKGSDGYLLVIPVGSYAIMLFSLTDGLDTFDFSKFNRLGPFRPPGSSGIASTIEGDL